VSVLCGLRGMAECYFRGALGDLHALRGRSPSFLAAERPTCRFLLAFAHFFTATGSFRTGAFMCRFAFRSTSSAIAGLISQRGRIVR